MYNAVYYQSLYACVQAVCSVIALLTTNWEREAKKVCGQMVCVVRICKYLL